MPSRQVTGLKYFARGFVLAAHDGFGGSSLEESALRPSLTRSYVEITRFSCRANIHGEVDLVMGLTWKDRSPPTQGLLL